MRHAGSSLQHADFLVAACGLLSCGMHVGSSSPTRDRTRTPCIGSAESYLVDHQVSPINKHLDEFSHIENIHVTCSLEGFLGALAYGSVFTSRQSSAAWQVSADFLAATSPFAPSSWAIASYAGAPGLITRSQGREDCCGWTKMRRKM